MLPIRRHDFFCIFAARKKRTDNYRKKRIEMKRYYRGMCIIPLQFVSEDGFLTGSKVEEIKLEVEVDEYITIDEMTVTFE